MKPGRYRITSPTLAVIHEDGHQVALMVPPGAIIDTSESTLDGDKLTGVLWHGEAVVMFDQYLQGRAERLEPERQCTFSGTPCASSPA